MSRFEKNSDYTRDKFDPSFWPRGGFIDDVFLHTLGFETTNLFSFWSAVSAVSALVQRDAYLRFGDNLYANFYVILCAPPAVVRKSTVVNLLDRAEQLMFSELGDCPLKERKQVPYIVRGKATAEILFDTMANREIVTTSGTTFQSDAVLIMRVSELSTFLSKAQFNVPLIDKLTDFYDCKNRDTDGSRGSGAKELKNIYATLFGATTPDSLQNSIPPEAFGGGFMSRCTIVNQRARDATRIIEVPYFNDDTPNREEIAHRMRWIMEQKHGEYVLDRETAEAYKIWYRAETLHLREVAEDGFEDHRNNRKTIQVLKLALLFSLQRYSTDRYITLPDFEMAVRVINYTLEIGTELVQDIALTGQEDGKLFRFINILREAGPAGLSRSELGKRYNFKSFEMNKFIHELNERGQGYEKKVPTGEKTPQGRDKTEKRIFFKET